MASATAVKAAEYKVVVTFADPNRPPLTTTPAPREQAEALAGAWRGSQGIKSVEVVKQMGR